MSTSTMKLPSPTQVRNADELLQCVAAAQKTGLSRREAMEILRDIKNIITAWNTSATADEQSLNVSTKAAHEAVKIFWNYLRGDSRKVLKFQTLWNLAIVLDTEPETQDFGSVPAPEAQPRPRTQTKRPVKAAEPAAQKLGAATKAVPAERKKPAMTPEMTAAIAKFKNGGK